MADRITDERLREMERALVAIDGSKPYRYEPTTSLPALSPQMQAALDAEAEMVAKVLKRAREMETELVVARAEVERLASERAELLETIRRNEDRSAGIDPHPLNDDAILSRADIAELVEEAKSKRGESAGRSMREIAEFEMVCTRSEYVSMANNLGRLYAEVEQLRADFREAMKLLRAHGQPPNWMMQRQFGATKEWNRSYGELLAKHKETP